MVVVMIRTISVAVAVAVMLMGLLFRTVSSVMPIVVSGAHSLGSATVAGTRAGTASPLAAVVVMTAITGTNAFGPVASVAGAIHTASQRTAGALTVTAVVMVRS